MFVDDEVEAAPSRVLSLIPASRTFSAKLWTLARASSINQGLFRVVASTNLLPSTNRSVAHCIENSTNRSISLHLRIVTINQRRNAVRHHLWRRYWCQWNSKVAGTQSRKPRSQIHGRAKGCSNKSAAMFSHRLLRYSRTRVSKSYRHGIRDQEGI